LAGGLFLFFVVVLATRCGIGYRIQTQAHLSPIESDILIPNDVIFRLDFGLPYFCWTEVIGMALRS
jgi:hypothetical protein